MIKILLFSKSIRGFLIMPNFFHIISSHTSAQGGTPEYYHRNLIF